MREEESRRARYIAVDPLRAGLAKKLDDYPCWHAMNIAAGAPLPRGRRLPRMGETHPEPMAALPPLDQRRAPRSVQQHRQIVRHNYGISAVRYVSGPVGDLVSLVPDVSHRPKLDSDKASHSKGC